MAQPLRVLLCEDDDHDAILLERLLRIHYGTDVVMTLARTHAEFETALAAGEFDVAVVDFVMPDLRVDDVLRALAERDMDVPVIVLSGTVSAQVAADVLFVGAKDFIQKGDEEPRLFTALAREIAAARQRQQGRSDAAAIAHFLTTQRAMLEAVLSAWASIEEGRDPETAGHVKRVTEVALALARRCGIADPLDLRDFRWSAALHDIGKTGVPDRILKKRGPLTRAEWKLMREHPQIAYDWLYPFFAPLPGDLLRILDIPYCHHEKYDGSGYPRGLKGEAIPLWARIFSPVDAWDAMRWTRRYSTARPDGEVWAELERCAGTAFDPQVIPVFLTMLQEGL